uniref:DUF1642 domain-containing protein n=1 Tax=Siphoviridae sp. ctcPV5 TaxID=2827582 RepID=A0A8S5LKE5_9CAUD|nr:MAG TPA: hypothetical protein [Siphoviridae sp. ctcPV5]
MKFDYFVENASEEADALYELEQQGFKWGVGENPTSLVISRIMGERVFPYTISVGKNKKIYWSAEENEETDEIKKYSIRQSLMQDLNNWKDDRRIYTDDGMVVSWEDFQNEPPCVTEWRLNTGSAIEANNRLIAIIQWLNGEDVFEVGTPKYIVQRKDAALPSGREYLYVFTDKSLGFVYSKQYATRFDDYMQASEWAGIHFEVVEVDE